MGFNGVSGLSSAQNNEFLRSILDLALERIR
jgi:hypothetical protein